MFPTDLEQQAIDLDTEEGAANLLSDPAYDSVGDNLIERIVLKLMADNPDADEADVRAAVIAHWVH